MTRPRLFAEFPAGLASVSLRLHGGPNCRPPISRMGAKTGYAEVILAALGLRSGGGAGAYWWAEADLDVAALLRCYPDAEMLRRVAEIIRGWADEPRALWTRLREERKARGAREDADVARWTALQGGACYSAPVTLGEDGASQPNGGLTLDPNRDPNGPHGGAWPASTGDACHRLAEFAYTANAHGGTGGWKVVPTTRPNTDANLSPDGLAARFEGMAREVAGWVQVADRSVAQDPTNFKPTSHGPDHHESPLGLTLRIGRTVAHGWPPVRITTQIPAAAEVADALGTPGDLDGVVVYMDPPYQGTTGYAANLTRAEVVAHALDFAGMGATVAISEAEPVIDGWHTAEITAGRKGQRRTFSRQQGEWLTMNREPAHRVATQAGLWGAA